MGLEPFTGFLHGVAIWNTVDRDHLKTRKTSYLPQRRKGRKGAEFLMFIAQIRFSDTDNVHIKPFK
jgi:hypothetical protein